MNPDITVDYATLKICVRNGLSPQGREYWWPILASISDQKCNLREYPDVTGTADRLLAMTCSISPMVALKKEVSLEKKYLLLLETLASAKSMGECPVLVTGFLQIISETIPRFDICHLICRDAIESTERRLSTRTGEYLSKIHVFRETLRNFMPKTFACMEALRALEPKFLNLIFMDFFKTLLPRVTVLRIVDSYLLEGDKILVRYGIALIMKYKNAIKSSKFKSGLMFWHQVQRDALSHGAFDVYQKNRHYYGREEGEEVTVIPTGLDGVTPVQPKEYMFDLIHRNAFDEKRGPFQKIVKPMQISRAKLVELADAYSAPKGELKAPFYPALGAAFGSGPMEGASRRASIANSYVDISALVLPVTIAQTIAKQSEILTEHSACQLLAMCFPFVQGSDPSPTPAPVPVDHGLYLLFSSGQHGFSLSSLYSRTQGISPLVVLIKSIRGETQHTIGAFLSEPLKTPCRRVIGNGESFLFTLADGKKSGNFAPAKKYPWAKKSKEKSPVGNLYIVEPPSPSASSMRCEGTMMQFAVFSATSMTFGASEAFGTNAVRIDADLSVCQCGPSDTYGNSTYSILTGSNHAVNSKAVPGQEANGNGVAGAGSGPASPTAATSGGGGSFRIESMEVYGDRHSFVAP